MDQLDELDEIIGSKLRRQRGAVIRESVSAPVSNFARAQLERLGWTEGTGLGKRRDGITTHIKVHKRKEASGLGSEKVALVHQQAEASWWLDSVGNTLARLSGNGGNNGDKVSATRRYTDEELFIATGGARFGMRAGKTRNLDKWKRVETDPRGLDNTTSSPRPPVAGPDEADETTDPIIMHRRRMPAKSSTKKRKANADAEDVVENDVTAEVVGVDDDDDDDVKKARKRSKKDKKPKKDKKMKKEKKDKERVKDA